MFSMSVNVSNVCQSALRYPLFHRANDVFEFPECSLCISPSRGISSRDVYIILFISQTTPAVCSMHWSFDMKILDLRCGMKAVEEFPGCYPPLSTCCILGVTLDMVWSLWLVELHENGSVDLVNLWGTNRAYDNAQHRILVMRNTNNHKNEGDSIRMKIVDRRERVTIAPCAPFLGRAVANSTWDEGLTSGNQRVCDRVTL